MNVLIVSNNTVSKVLNNGKTQENIFDSFNDDNIFQLFVRPQARDFMDLEFCESYFLILEKKMLNVKRNSGKIFTVKDCERIENDVEKYDKLIKVRSGFSTIIREILWITCLWKTTDLKLWVKEIKPDVIFFDAGNLGGLHILVRYLAKMFSIPYVVYNSDDYVINPISNGIFSKIHKKYIKYQYTKTYINSSLNYCINSYMCKAYEQYFDRRFSILTNSVRVEKCVDVKTVNPIVISYFGGLHLNRWKMIMRFSTLLPVNVILNVYTFNELSIDKKDMMIKSNVILNSGLGGDELKCAISNSDVLLHVESDDPTNKSLTMLSMSTKIPEYLMAGRLVLGFGPKDVSSMKFIDENEVGIVVSSSNSDADIKKKLSILVKDKNLIKEYGIKAFEFAKLNFDKKIISAGFRNSLERLLNEK